MGQYATEISMFFLSKIRKWVSKEVDIIRKNLQFKQWENPRNGKIVQRVRIRLKRLE